MTVSRMCAMWIRPRRLVLVCLLTVLGLAVGQPDAVRQVMAVEAPRIEITIRDFKFVRTKMQPIRAGVPMVFVIHNEDATRHGFVSPLFAGRAVQGGGEGIEAFGQGIEGFHVDPGKTLTIHLTPDRQGKITFRCDLHPDVEGELYLLDVPVG